MSIQTLKSQRGANIVVYDDYMFNFDKIVEGKERWRCKTRSCKAFILKHDELIELNKSHNHQSHTKEIKKIS